jgi:hypothetical protein
MRRIGLIVGNGLSLDIVYFLSKSSPSLKESWNPQKPLSWILPTPDQPHIPLLPCSLPRLAAFVDKIKREGKELSDFDIFERICKHIEKNNESSKPYIPKSGDSYNKAAAEKEFNLSCIEAEARHFLAIAYSHFQLQLDLLEIKGWPWLEWINESVKELISIVSFNYDLILETALDKSGATYRRFGIYTENNGIPILKPHGSIDFEVTGIMMPTGYPLKNVAIRNDFPIKILRREELNMVRTEADIVLPHEYSPLSTFQWVKPGYAHFQEVGPTLTHCVFLGLSYWDCDRPEIDFLIKHLNQRTKIVVANPEPPKKFMKQITSKFTAIELWRGGPKQLV